LERTREIRVYFVHVLPEAVEHPTEGRGIMEAVAAVEKI
jgi:hypothetical protein